MPSELTCDLFDEDCLRTAIGPTHQNPLSTDSVAQGFLAEREGDVRRVNGHTRFFDLDIPVGFVAENQLRQRPMLRAIELKS